MTDFKFLLGLFQLTVNNNLGFILIENNLAVQIYENISNLFLLLPATAYSNFLQSGKTAIAAISNIPSSANISNYYYTCEYVFENYLI